MVTISAEIQDPLIIYTTDGSSPSESNGTVYSEPVLVDRSVIIRVFVRNRSGYNIGSAVYNIGDTIAGPFFAATGWGSNSFGDRVTLSSTTEGAEIRYTMDGTTPTPTHGIVYSGPIALSLNVTRIKAIAYKERGQASPVGAVHYVISPYTRGGVTYEYNDGVMTVLKCDKKMTGSLAIPAKVDGFSVTAIGPRAFEDCTGLTDLILPDGVTSIGAGAFSGCSGLESIILSAGVTVLRDETFSNCSKLRTVFIKALKAPELGSDVFKGVGDAALHINTKAIGYRDSQWNAFTIVESS